MIFMEGFSEGVREVTSKYVEEFGVDERIIRITKAIYRNHKSSLIRELLKKLLKEVRENESKLS